MPHRNVVLPAPIAAATSSPSPLRASQDAAAAAVPSPPRSSSVSSSVTAPSRSRTVDDKPPLAAFHDPATVALAKQLIVDHSKKRAAAAAAAAAAASVGSILLDDQQKKTKGHSRRVLHSPSDTLRALLQLQLDADCEDDEMLFHDNDGDDDGGVADAVRARARAAGECEVDNGNNDDDDDDDEVESFLRVANSSSATSSSFSGMGSPQSSSASSLDDATSSSSRTSPTEALKADGEKATHTKREKGATAKHRGATRCSVSSADLQSIIHSMLSTAGDFDEEGDDRNRVIREYAATLIQRRVRRLLDLRRTRMETESVARLLTLNRDIPDNAVEALRVLQNRFRFQRLRRMVEERERNAVISRLQQLWRKRRAVRQHYVQLRAGREDAAARDIQRAFLRHITRRGSGRHSRHSGDELREVRGGNGGNAVTVGGSSSLHSGDGGATRSSSGGNHATTASPSTGRSTAFESSMDGGGDSGLLEVAVPRRRTLRRPASDTTDTSAANSLRAQRNLPESRGGGGAILDDDGDSGSGVGIPRCLICLTEPVQIAFLPCGHAHVCVNCGSHFNRCVCCRTIIALQVRIFL